MTKDIETTTTPLHFWRNNITWRTTNTGINKNVLRTLTPIHNRKLYQPTYQCEYLTLKEKKKLKQFENVVNDCLHSIYNGELGYVFTKDQLNEVIKILPSVQVKRDVISCCYCCWNE